METYRPNITDKYHIQESLGEGATAEVYKADEVASGRSVALKIYNFDYPIQDQMHEAEMLAQIVGCPNTVQLVEFAPYAENPYIATTYHEGNTLRTILDVSETMYPYQGAQLLSDVATGVGAVHKKGIVHGDIKPANIQVDSDNSPTMIDFGHAIGVRIGETYHQDSVFTTPQYMSPERIHKQCSHTCDVYSTGVVGYEIFTGKNPFEDEFENDILLKQLRLPPPSFERLLGSEMDKSLDPFEEVILKAVAKDTRDRHADMDELRDALQEGLANSLKITAKDLVIIG